MSDNNKFNSRIPRYNDDSNYTTNAPSYYDDLARKNALLEKLAHRIWEYQELINTQFSDWDDELTQRFLAWDKNLEEFDDEVLRLLQEWMQDGTLDHIINDTIFSWKADKTYVDDELDKKSDLTYVDDEFEELNTQLTDTVGYSVDQYGAVGDGVTNDTDAIQNLIDLVGADGGGTIVFSAKTYIATLKIPSNTRLVGMGYNTVIKLRDNQSTPTPVIFNEDKVNGNSNIVIENLRIDGNRSKIWEGATKNQGQPWEGINLIDCNNWTLRNIWVENCENDGLDFDGGHTILVDGFYAKNCGGCAIHPSTGQGDLVNSDVILRNVWSKDNNHDYNRGGIYLFGSDGLVLDGYFSENDYIGLQISGTNMQINNVQIKNPLTRGIQIEVDTDNVSISNVEILNAGTDGVYVNGSDLSRQSIFEKIKVVNAGAIGYRFSGTDCIINSCVSDGSEGVGFNFYGVDDSVISDCLSKRSGGVGFLISTTKNANVSNCIVIDGTSRGIELINCERITVNGNRSGNVELNTQTYGIAISGTSSDHTIVGNNLKNNTTAPIQGTQTGHFIKNNNGEGLETSDGEVGTATIVAGNNSVTVNHNLGRTPKNVLLTPASDRYEKYWYSNRTSTTFIIFVDPAPTEDASFSWSVK